MLKGVSFFTPAEARTAEHLATPISEHVSKYATHLEAVGTSAKHVYGTRRRFKRLLSDCQSKTPSSSFSTWLTASSIEPRKTR